MKTKEEYRRIGRDKIELINTLAVVLDDIPGEIFSAYDVNDLPVKAELLDIKGKHVVFLYGKPTLPVTVVFQYEKPINPIINVH